MSGLLRLLLGVSFSGTSGRQRALVLLSKSPNQIPWFLSISPQACPYRQWPGCQISRHVLHGVAPSGQDSRPSILECKEAVSDCLNDFMRLLKVKNYCWLYEIKLDFLPDNKKTTFPLHHAIVWLGLYNLWTPALWINLHTKLCIRPLLIFTDQWLNYSPSFLSKGLKGETFTLSFQWYSVISRRYPHTTAAICFKTSNYTRSRPRL